MALIDSNRSPGPARFRYYDALIGNLREAGFSVDTAARALSLLDSYIKGFALQQTSMSFDSDEDLADAASALLPNIAVEYPHLAELTAYTYEMGYDYEEHFAFGLDLILDALQGLRADEAT
jgi:hypothetical protein